MIKLDKAVIVEGKYDKIRLSNIIDATIITTEGFRIFKDKEKRELIRVLAQKRGIIIMTDSDRAGQMIRKHIENIVKGADIQNVYLPVIKDKEKRKIKPSAEGSLGVEGTDDEIILDSLKKVGIIGEKRVIDEPKITKTDLYNLGLTGGQESKMKREKLLLKLGFPTFLSANTLLEILNSLYTLSEVKQWMEE